MKKQKIRSPRQQVWLAGLAILLASVIIFLGVAYLIIFPFTVRQGCGPHYYHRGTDTLSGTLTSSIPEQSTSLGRINYIAINSLETANHTPIVIHIMDSNNNTYLNATHPTQINLSNTSIALEARYYPYIEDFLTLTIHRITNDTTFTLHYTLYMVSYLCIDPVPPFSFLIVLGVFGLMLIIIGFRDLDKIAKLASRQ